MARRTVRFAQEARDLGLHLRALREDQELTLEQAAERMDVAPKHLQKIEAGKINLTLVSLVRIADGLGTSVRNLFPRPPPAKK